MVAEFQIPLTCREASDQVRQGTEDAEIPDDDQAVTDAELPVHEVVREGLRGFGEADHQERAIPFTRLVTGFSTNRVIARADPLRRDCSC